MARSVITTEFDIPNDADAVADVLRFIDFIWCVENELLFVDWLVEESFAVAEFVEGCRVCPDALFCFVFVARGAEFPVNGPEF